MNQEIALNVAGLVIHTGLFFSCLGGFIFALYKNDLFKAVLALGIYTFISVLL